MGSGLIDSKQCQNLDSQMVYYLRLLTVVLFAFCAGLLEAQESQIFVDAQKNYKDGLSYYKKGLYGKAFKSFDKAVVQLEPLADPKAPTLLSQAELGKARSAIRMEKPEGEVMALNFVRKYSPDPIADEALVEVGSFYFNARDYKKAINFYERAQISSLPKKEQSEIRFKTGYSYFVQKEFDKAKQNFEPISETENQYFYPTNYYLGLCYFFEGDYTTALKHLRVVESSGKYEDYVPFYVAQILFGERKYYELIEYVKPRIDMGRNLRKLPELHQLLGQSYFELEQYENALPHLEYYDEKSNRLREEEFYQLAYTQYQNGKYADAVKNFEELSGVDSKLGQYAMFYLGDSYLKMGNKPSAWTAMGKAYNLDYDQAVTQEALYNYAKLSYEIRAYNEASEALQKMDPQSPYFKEGQALLGKIFLNYRDYEQALALLRQVENPSNELKATYHKVLLYRGMQLLGEEKIQDSKTYFQQASNLPFDAKIKAYGTFWLGEIAHREKLYDQSIRYLDQFLRESRGMSNLEPSSSPLAANYIQGYNYLKKGNYSRAGNYFTETVKGIRSSRRYLGESKIVDQVLEDAVLRAGDSHLEQNQFNQAVTYYDDAINNRFNGMVYALYQKALIEGLRNNTTDKIVALERIANNYQDSEWADDALFNLGTTYVEINRPQQAIPPLERLTNRYKTTSNLVNQGMIKLGLIYYNQNDLQKAVNYYKQVVTNNPTPAENSVALTALEEIYVKELSRPDEYFAFLQSVGQDVGSLGRDSVSFQAAQVQFLNGQYDRAIPAYSSYIQQFPNGRHTLEAYFNRGECYGILNRWNESLADFERVVQQGPSQYLQQALYKAALIAYNNVQDFPKALQLFTQLEQSTMSEEQKFEAQLGALRAAYRIPDAVGVRTWATKVASNPYANDQQAAMAQFYLGKLAYDQRDYFNALNAFNEVIAKTDNEQTAEARYLIANIYYQQGQLDRAQDLCLNSNRESSAHPYWVAKSVLLLSDIFVQKRDLLNAQAALEALLRNYQGDQQIIQEANAKLQAVNQRINQESRLDPGNNVNEFMDNSGNNRGGN